MLKKYRKNIWNRFWASKSTAKTFELDFEPQKVPQKHLDSILSLKKYHKIILTRFWASRSTAKAFLHILFSSGRVGAYCIRHTNDPEEGSERTNHRIAFSCLCSGVLHTPHKRSRGGSERTNYHIAFSYHGRSVLHTPHKRSRGRSVIAWCK